MLYSNLQGFVLHIATLQYAVQYCTVQYILSPLAVFNVDWTILSLPNSWTDDSFEVFGHNLESSQTWDFCMDFFKPYGRGCGFLSCFLPSPLQCTVTHWRNCKRLREFKEIEISRQSCRDDLNSEEGNSWDFCLYFVQEFGLWTVYTSILYYVYKRVNLFC